MGSQSMPQQFQQDSSPKASGKFKHPFCVVFHLLWKVAALLTYLFARWVFSLSYVAVLITCIILVAFDFWTVKNVTGRIMVGLRWWNEIKDDGSNEWVFESKEDRGDVNTLEKLVFWGALVGSPLLWLLFGLASLLNFNFQWLLIVMVALALGTANLVGYVKCAKEAKAQVSAYAQNYIAQSIVNKAMTTV